MNLELLLLHALPLDGSMWSSQLDIFPGATYAPTLYGFGDRVEDWAAEALRLPSLDGLSHDHQQRRHERILNRADVTYHVAVHPVDGIVATEAAWDHAARVDANGSADRRPVTAAHREP